MKVVSGDDVGKKCRNGTFIYSASAMGVIKNMSLRPSDINLAPLDILIMMLLKRILFSKISVVRELVSVGYLNLSLSIVSYTRHSSSLSRQQLQTKPT